MKDTKSSTEFLKLIEEDQYEINHELGYIRLKSFYMNPGYII